MNSGAYFRAGSWAAEEIAKRLGVDISKALDPLNAGDFVLICARLSRALNGAVAGAEGEAMKAAIDTLDVDWPNLTETARDRVIAAARAEISGLSSTVPDLVGPVFEASATKLVTGTRIAACAKFDFSAQIRNAAPIDTETIQNLQTSQMVYVKDQYGARSDAVDAFAKDIVSSGLERGLGRDDISEELAARLKETGVTRTEDYWKLIASDFANKARTTTQLNTFERAGIVRYRFDSVMDQATSEICRLLHGRVFSVVKAGKMMRHSLSLEDPEQIRNTRPWVQTGTNENGDQILYFNRGGDRHVVAHVDEPGEGTIDRAGSYSKVMSNKTLEAAGVTVPPLHSHCRSTITTDE